MVYRNSKEEILQTTKRRVEVHRETEKVAKPF